MNNGSFNLENQKRKWYFKWWSIPLIISISVFFIFLVYFSFLVYNEYQNIIKGKSNNNYSLKKFLEQQKTFEITDQRLMDQDDPYLGNPLAKVKIIEFGDFQCPYCQESFPAVRKIAENYGNQIQIIYRDFPLSEIHPQAEKAAEAAACAQKQGKFWSYHDKLFLNQDNLTVKDLLKYAQELNLNINQFTNCLNTGEMTNEVLADYNDGENLGIKGTPTFIINGIMVAGVLDEQKFEAIINYLLGNQK